ncbi:MAG: hypothetical protein ABIH27_02030 [Candidatus Omnitrophota bacterium]
MSKNNQIAILFSGGTDSTCAAAIMTDRFNVIHLITLNRFGFFSVENSSCNVRLLQQKFSTKIFIHNFINTDNLARYISYNNFIRNLFKYGFFMLSNCLICGLVNHFRALIFCLDNDIKDVADGSTREWSFFPTHMEKIINELKKMYAEFKIDYHTPVYDFALPQPMTFKDKINIPITGIDSAFIVNSKYSKTTGNYLHDIGIFPAPNIKGSDLDRKMQPHCFQFVLHHIYVYWYYMTRNKYADFELLTLSFFKEKISDFTKILRGNSKIISHLKK